MPGGPEALEAQGTWAGHELLLFVSQRPWTRVVNPLSPSCLLCERDITPFSGSDVRIQSKQQPQEDVHQVRGEWHRCLLNHKMQLGSHFTLDLSQKAEKQLVVT